MRVRRRRGRRRRGKTDPFLSWILALVLSIVSEDYTSRVIVLLVKVLTNTYVQRRRWTSGTMGSALINRYKQLVFTGVDVAGSCDKGLVSCRVCFYSFFLVSMVQRWEESVQLSSLRSIDVYAKNTYFCTDSLIFFHPFCLI